MSKASKKISGIYAITNKVNGRIYIGSSNNVKKRWSSWKSDLKYGRGNKNLREDYNKQKPEDFVYSILEECLQRDLPILEKKWKDFYGDKVYNISDIKTSTKKIRRGREAKAFKEKWSLQNQGENNPHCTKFNVPMIKEIKRAIQDGVDLAVIAEKYDTTENYINAIKYGNKWKHVTIEQDVIL